MFIKIKSKTNGGATTTAIKIAREKSKVLYLSCEDGIKDIIHNVYTTPESRLNNMPQIDKVITFSKKLIEETIKNNLFDDTEYDEIIIDNINSFYNISERRDLYKKIEVFSERNTNKTVIVIEHLNLVYHD